MGKSASRPVAHLVAWLQYYRRGGAPPRKWGVAPIDRLVSRVRDARMSVPVAIAFGAVLGLALGIVVSVTTDIPLAPEAGLVLGALLGWLARRGRWQRQ